MEFRQTWELDSIFFNGSDPSKFELFIENLNNEIESLRDNLKRLNSLLSITIFKKIVVDYEHIKMQVDETNSFIYCIISENLNCEKGKMYEEKIHPINTSLELFLNEFDLFIAKISDECWCNVLKEPLLKDLSFTLNEWRMRSKVKIGPESILSEDGLNAWGKLYEDTVSNMHISFEHNGNKNIISIGQAEMRLYDENRALRKEIFKNWEKAWEEKGPLIAKILNHIGGYRLAVHKYRPYRSLLHESLEKNRMQETTLHSMWSAVEENKSLFIAYLKRKAELMGVEKLGWHDVSAPIFLESEPFTYDQAINLIIEQFHQFNPNMSSFVQFCVDHHWIESEDRVGKRNGGFCLNFPLSKQSRIFMTYSNATSSVFTLAHELGHAYHNYLMRDIPYLNQQYSPIVGETASTFSELLIADAFIEKGKSEKNKIALLDKKIERCITYFMNVRSRFLFEERFYERRMEGFVPVSELKNLMVESQKEAFGNALSLYDPSLWASKMHFYFIQDGPFYNYPYTFGYLFSSGIYAFAKQFSSTFKEKYDDLLRDTGTNTVEGLAEKYLGVNLQKKDFWQKAINVSLDDIREFLKVTEHCKKKYNIVITIEKNFSLYSI